MKNIVFSSTKQWNPGDEFILLGVRQILAKIGVAHNAILYNRHPGLRSTFMDRQYFRYSKIPSDFAHDASLVDLEANLKFGFLDNSLKPGMDCSFVDMVILAGTPEWCNGRMLDLYESILKFQLPVIVLGVGGDCEIYQENFREVIAKAKLLTVRDRCTQNAVRAQGFEAELLPCPALLAAPTAFERQVETVRKIALVYQASASASVPWNGGTDGAYGYLKALFAHLIAAGAQIGMTFEIVCHYIDELPLAMADFPGVPVHYAHDALDYQNIYRRFDLVVGPRVHGIGMCASLGIPGLAIAHDRRAGTCEGFLAELVETGTDVELVWRRLLELAGDAAGKSRALAVHKRATMARYAELLAGAMQAGDVRYEGGHEISKAYEFELARLEPVARAILSLLANGRPVHGQIDPPLSALAPELRERLIHIEAKLDALMRR